MPEHALTTDPPRPAKPSRLAEILLIATFAVICATVGGLLHLAAELPASTAALTALASMSIILAINASARRKSTKSLLDAQIAELRMEINGLRKARAAPPFYRPQMSAGSPSAASRHMANRRPQTAPQAGNPRGAHPASPPPPRLTVPPPIGPAQAPSALQPRAMAGTAPSAPADGPVAPTDRKAGAPSPAAAGDQASPKREPSQAPPPPSLPAPKQPPKMDWTLRPGAKHEPTIRMPEDKAPAPAPSAAGPLPLMPGDAALARANAPSAERTVLPPQRRTDSDPATSEATNASPQSSKLGTETPANTDDAAPQAAPVSTEQAASEAASGPSDAKTSRDNPPPAPVRRSIRSAIDGLSIPPSDGAPNAMSRPGTSAWPRVVPKSPTSPLDLDTMQNLIEQLAGQLDPEPLDIEAISDVPGDPGSRREATSAAPVAYGRAAAMTAPSHAPPGALSRAPNGRQALERDPAPFGQLALIADAVEAQRMDVLLDPILGLSDRRARHFELSVCLLTENGEGMGQAQYTRAAAGTGLLARIDAEKLNRAADVLQRLRARGSAASLFSTVAGESLSDDNFAKAFTGVLEAEQGNGSRLVLTFEQAEARNFTDAHWRAISDMSRIGLKFAMTGVTDLDMDFEILKSHGFDFIKLDARVFLEGLPTPTGVVPAADICRYLAGMGLGLIVGGIVEEKDLARILGFGVLLGQGELFGGPRSVELERERRAA